MKERRDRIGSNLGLRTRDMIEIIIEQSRVPVVVNAGIGLPSHAAEAIELGTDAVLANTAIAAAGDPVKMAEAFSTHPLSVGTWEPAPFTSLVAAKDGEVVRVSPPHGHEYIYNPEDYRLVYMNFARL